MVFSSPLFLFLFLPVVITVYVSLPGTRARNFWLLLVSLVFYSWGQIDFIFLLLASTLANYFLGWWVDHHQNPANRKNAVMVAVVFNIGLLAFFKYADFAIGTLNSFLHLVGGAIIPLPHVTLPLGISFFTFHALSYVIDVYRRKWPAASNPQDVALYIFLFPQLIAGPILRWSAIGPQLRQRTLNRDDFAEGIRRFVGGLAKKVLIANTVAYPASQIFALPANQLSQTDAWLGILCYTLQIYFDFSGYSDMAIGLGKMFGFTFMENFNFPYISRSVREFWQRWHISLSTWFRDYVYIPLGGNRISNSRTYLNLMVVFFLCGLWHGASLTFVVWGIYHGFFLALERTSFGKMLEKLPQSVRHLYTIFLVMMGWVIFRSDNFTLTKNYFQALFGLHQAAAAQPYARYLSYQTIAGLFLGILFCGPLWPKIKAAGGKLGLAAAAAGSPWLQTVGMAMELVLTAGTFLISAIWAASGTYNPFIYFRF
jgi:alginate O-acetyltransferase complex protein AlgI